MSNQIPGSVGTVSPRTDIVPATAGRSDVQTSLSGDATPPVSATEPTGRTRESREANRYQLESHKDPETQSLEKDTSRHLRGSEPLAALTDELNDKIRAITTNIRFSFDEDYGDTVIKVIDSENDELIRQIPAEHAVALTRFLRELEEHGGEAKVAELSRNSSQGRVWVEGLLLDALA